MKQFKIAFLFVLILGLTYCSSDDEPDNIYEDGSYRAELNEFSRGWKEFMEVTIQDDKVTVVNIDADGEDGSLKSSLTEYPMPIGLPSEWYPLLEAQYLESDITDFSGVDGITGATGTSTNMDALFRLILDAAKDGDTSTQIYTPAE